MEQMTEVIAVRFIELLNCGLLNGELAQIQELFANHPETPMSTLSEFAWADAEEIMCDAFEDSTGCKFFQNSEEHRQLWEAAWRLVKDRNFTVA